MNTIASGRRGAAPPLHAGTTPLDLLGDFGREQLALVMECSAAMWRGFEAMRAIQQRAAQEVSVRHRAAAHHLRRAAQPADLVAMPATLWQGDLEAAARMWQALAEAALEVQLEAAQSACSHVVDAETALETAAAIDSIDLAPQPPARVRRAGGARATRRRA